MPNPDKPELNIADCRLKICGIATLYKLFFSDNVTMLNW